MQLVNAAFDVEDQECKYWTLKNMLEGKMNCKSLCVYVTGKPILSSHVNSLLLIVLPGSRYDLEDELSEIGSRLKCLLACSWREDKRRFVPVNRSG